ncbi:hypothetical protein ACWNYO_00110 [Candidatus Vidania fulgoroideorum]
MHSCKNDFIFVKNKNVNIRDISNRYTGVGFDQAFIINYVDIKKKIVFINIYNNDGTIAESCGNGLKCLGKYIFKKYKLKNFLSVSYKKNFTKIFVNNKNIFLKINTFSFLFSKIRFIYLKRSMHIVLKNKNFSINYENMEFKVFSIGNPHLVFFFNKKNIFLLKKIFDNFFLKGINLSTYSNNIRTFERGAGLTKSCGTATTSVGICLMLEKSIFLFKRNNMVIFWKGKNIFSRKNVFIIGRANFIFKGTI